MVESNNCRLDTWTISFTTRCLLISEETLIRVYARDETGTKERNGNTICRGLDLQKTLTCAASAAAKTIGVSVMSTWGSRAPIIIPMMTMMVTMIMMIMMMMIIITTQILMNLS